MYVTVINTWYTPLAEVATNIVWKNSKPCYFYSLQDVFEETEAMVERVYSVL